MHTKSNSGAARSKAWPASLVGSLSLPFLCNLILSNAQEVDALSLKCYFQNKKQKEKCNRIAVASGFRYKIWNKAHKSYMPLRIVKLISQLDFQAIQKIESVGPIKTHL